MSYFVSDIFPLKVGTKWLYRVDYKLLFSRDLSMEVMDKKNDFYLVKFHMNNTEWSVILKSNVDLFIIKYINKGLNALNTTSVFQDMSKTLLLKSPVLQGNSWESGFGTFKIISTQYRLKIGNKTVPNCIHLHLKDSSNADNNIYIKEGIGIVSASIYIDNLGLANISLKKFN